MGAAARTQCDAPAEATGCSGGGGQWQSTYPTTVPANVDCNDDVATVHPGADELCDGYDTDCRRVSTHGLDFLHEDDDDDGYADCAGLPIGRMDCNDLDPAIHPSATETVADGVDYDCDGQEDLLPKQRRGLAPHGDDGPDQRDQLPDRVRLRARLARLRRLLRQRRARVPRRDQLLLERAERLRRLRLRLRRSVDAGDHLPLDRRVLDRLHRGLLRLRAGSRSGGLGDVRAGLRCLGDSGDRLPHAVHGRLQRAHDHHATAGLPLRRRAREHRPWSRPGSGACARAPRAGSCGAPWR
ncbi:MAG: putative metal-binding motif-containing protein [Sandaracinaceae bacterium]|nr:putative metal-binding motif-containing protein [Sandaracinaceae bacterium]